MLQIGPHTLENNLLLAPMAGVTDVAFRSLCLSLGAAYAPSEMISSDTSLHASEKTLTRIRQATGSGADENLHAVQIVGSEPHVMAQAAQFNVSRGARIIDINMGCPAKKVCRKLAGSALMADEPLVRKILQSVVSAVNVPVTLKIRTGPSRANRNGLTIAKIAEEAGISCIAIHGRTREDKFAGTAEYATIAQIKSELSIPVIANGDITDAKSAARVLRETRADGLMIGRAAQGNPFVFRQIAAFLQSGCEVPEPSAAEVHHVLSQHLRALYDLYGEYKGVRIARKHISWYCKSRHGAASFRAEVNLVESSADQLRLVDLFFENSCAESEFQSKLQPDFQPQQQPRA